MKLAIAVLCYNQPQLVTAMHEQLGNDMIVVDNGSTVPLPFYGNSITLPENGYFAGGWNRAMNSLSWDNYEWVAMLNSDIEGVTQQSLSILVQLAEAHKFAAISPAFNSPHAHMQPRGRHGVQQVAWLDWTAVVMNMRAWIDVGGFNAEAFPGYGADLDLAYRLKKRGYKLAVDYDTVIHHLGSVTALAEGLQGIQGDVGAMNASFQRLYGAPTWDAFIRQYL